MSERHDVLIIGSGFSGLCMGIFLRRAGIENFVILEKSGDVGGVWRHNTYPGACCDIPANLYSFSFEMKTDWSRRYPPQPEIQQYMRDTARKYGLVPHIRFGAEVQEARFDDASSLWTVTLAGGETLTARALVSGVGQLGRPAYPVIPGLERFAGKVFHSAEWDHGYDLTGKRVAVIGTGASAIQFVPVVAGQAAQLHVIQRSAPWIIPKPDQEYGPVHRFLFRRVPGWQKLYRAFWYRLGEISCGAFNKNSHLAAVYRALSSWYMRRHVKDPALQARLTPDYPIGCKRVLFSSNYYEALARPNVEVVTEAVQEGSERGLRLASGRELELDCIIHGTGFRATEFLSPMRIHGRNGLDLNQAWRDGAEAYLGISVSGFPNFFMLYGPNTNLGSNSIIFMIECQAGYILACLQQLLLGRGVRQIEVRDAVQRRYNEAIQKELQDSVWAAGCHSWYHTDAGKITNNWPGYTQAYKRRTAQVDFGDYELRLA